MAVPLGLRLERGILSPSQLFNGGKQVQSALWDFSTHSHENIPSSGCSLFLSQTLQRMWGRSRGSGECLHGMDKCLCGKAREWLWDESAELREPARECRVPDPCPAAGARLWVPPALPQHQLGSWKLGCGELSSSWNCSPTSGGVG